MLARRVIPCLDVHAGQVTRGVQFGRAEAGELRNVGDPVDLAIRYNDQGADEMVFFDITASAHGRATKKTISSAPWSDRKSTRLNSSHRCISYAVFCLKKK